MNDLDLVEKFRADVPPADPAVLARARARMLGGPDRRRPAMTWLRLATPAAGLAAAALVAVTVAANQPGPAGTPDAAGSQPVTIGGRSAPATVGEGSAPAPADAATVLRLAASEVRTDQTLKARPDQFLFVESLADWANATANQDGSITWNSSIERNRKAWLSVDGTRDGLIRDTRTKEPLGDDDRSGPIEAGLRAYRTDLPTTAKGMRAYLAKDEHDAAGMFEQAKDLIQESYLPPAALAALYEAVARIPGVKLVPGQVDLAGRKGIAVSRNRPGLRDDLIFDPTTHRYLGQRSVLTERSGNWKAGTVIEYTAQLRMAIVDRAGQLP